MAGPQTPRRTRRISSARAPWGTEMLLRQPASPPLPVWAAIPARGRKNRSSWRQPGMILKMTKQQFSMLKRWSIFDLEKLLVNGSRRCLDAGVQSGSWENILC